MSKCNNVCLFLRKTTWKFNFWKPNIFFKLVLKYTFFPHLSMPDFKPKQKHFHNFGFRYMNSIKFQFQLKSKIPYLVTSVEASLVFTLVVWGLRIPSSLNWWAWFIWRCNFLPLIIKELLFSNIIIWFLLNSFMGP